MTYDNELTLIQNTYTEDDIGNQVPSESKTPIFCGLKSVGRTEFYNAATAGIKPVLIFLIHSYEYNGETIIEFEGNRYKVIRTYSASFEELELTCERC